MPKVSSLREYLEALSEDRRATFARLRALVRGVDVPSSNDSFVFIAGQAGHPVFDDAEAVFWKAAEQLYLSEAVSDGELPLVYWGFHSIDLLGRRRANGVLITDRTVYLDDVGRESSQRAIATVDPAAIRVVDGALEVAGSTIDLAQISHLAEGSCAEDAAAYLTEVILALQAVEEAEARVDDEQQSVESLVLASRLSSDFLIPSRSKDVKGLAKLASKWKLPADETLLVSLSSATFVGVYGIAVTNRALYSKDLMEDLQRTPLESVDGFAWDSDEKKFRVSGDHLAPSLPSITDDNRAYAAALLGKLVQAAQSA